MVVVLVDAHVIGASSSSRSHSLAGGDDQRRRCGADDQHRCGRREQAHGAFILRLCAALRGRIAALLCNTSLSIDERVDDFIGRLSLEEKVALIGPDPSLGSTCNDHTAGVARLGVPQWMWLVETNTGDNSACYAQDRCASTFPGPMAMGASFNRSSWRLKGSVLGSELRAFNNLGWHRDTRGEVRDLIGLTGFGPNINIARDPRFGRSSELPGEDPTLSGVYATEMVQGMQEEDAHGYPKMLAFLKHFTAYSTETNRGHDDYKISQHDLFETYLPQYEMAFTKGGASGAMCSYNAVNGHPSCANSFVLDTLVKKTWSPHAIITTDCGAVHNLLGPPANAPSNEAAAAWALNNGTDIEMGSTEFTDHLVNATKLGLTTEAAVTAAARRTQRALFRLGRFDPPGASEWHAFGEETLNSSAHQAAVWDAALQGLVLLKNDGGALPLAAGGAVAVLGPQAVGRRSLLSDYYGDDVCWTGSCSGHECYDWHPTIVEAVASYNMGGTTTSAAGVDINSNATSGIAAALASAAPPIRSSSRSASTRRSRPRAPTAPTPRCPASSRRSPRRCSRSGSRRSSYWSTAAPSPSTRWWRAPSAPTARSRRTQSSRRSTRTSPARRRSPPRSSGRRIAGASCR